MSKRSASVLGCLMIGAALVSGAARAEENGIKIGDGRMHPYFDLETRYDTAAQLAADTNGAATGSPDFVLHFRPGLKLDVPSPTFAVSLDGRAEYLAYTGLTNKTSRQLDRLQAEGNLDLGILRGSTVSADLGDHFSRSDQSTNAGLAFGVLSLYNDANASVAISPGGGALTVTPGYHLTLENFSPLLGGILCATPGCAAADPSGFNYLNHRLELVNRWRFWPKTAFLLDGEYDFRTYANPGAGNTPIQYFKATTGIAGLFTPHVSVIARAGFGMDVTAKSYESAIGQLEVSYLPNETSAVRVGYVRTFEPVPAPFVTFGDDRGYVEGRALVLSRLTLHLTGAADYYTFRGSSGRFDLVFSVDGGADFEALRWLIISAGDAVSNRSSSSSDVATLNYTGDQAYLRFTFIY